MLIFLSMGFIMLKFLCCFYTIPLYIVWYCDVYKVDIRDLCVHSIISFVEFYIFIMLNFILKYFHMYSLQ
jgi:hypothetical protein